MEKRESVFLKTPIGWMQLTGTRRRVECIRFVSGKGRGAGAGQGALRRCALEIREYFAGKRSKFGVRLHAAGTPFDAKVWRLLKALPCARTASYAELAEALGSRRLARAVGQAAGRNPLALVVPCHRLIESGGSPGGYAWGSAKKRWLLAHEERMAAQTLRREKSCGIIPVLRKENHWEYLIVRHRAGHWGFPKGHAQKGETEIRTALRELREETGIVPYKTNQAHKLVERYGFAKPGCRVEKSVVYFAAWVRSPRVQIAKSELMDWRWCAFKEARRTLTFKEARSLLVRADKLIGRKTFF